MKAAQTKIAEIAAQRDPWEAPDHLAKDARDIWNQVVSSVSGDHFAEGDRAVLGRFCQTEARYRKLARVEARQPAMHTDQDKAKAYRLLMYELQTLRAQLTSMTRVLRLAPSGRPNRDKRTDMPTRNPAKATRAAKKKGSDLFAC